MNVNTKWYRSPWTKGDVARCYGTSLLNVGVRAVPFIGSVAFFDMSFEMMALVVVGITLAVAFVSFLVTATNLASAREIAPLGIGLDSQRIYIDRSAWSYGARVTSFPIADLRRLRISHVPEHLNAKRISWFTKALRGLSTPTQPVVGFDYQDRIGKYLYRPSGVDLAMSDVGELIYALAHQPGVTFMIETRTVHRDVWLAMFREIQNVDTNTANMLLLKAETVGL